MKRFLTITKKIMIFVCLFVATIVVSGCKDDKKPVTPDDVNISMTANVDKETLEKGDEVTFTVTVTGTKNTKYTLEVTEKGGPVDYAVIENNVLKITKDVTIDKIINVTAKSVADEYKTAVKTYTVKAPIIEGRVGDLTSDLITEISGNNITFKGIVTDYYDDLNNNRNDEVTEYEMTVKMEEGKWSGSFNPKEDPEAVITDTYFKGEDGDIKGPSQYDQNTGKTTVQIGHALEYEYVNKYNEVVREKVKDYVSIPAIWEYQHLWNHLGQLNVNKFTYDPENEIYKYNYTTIEDAYLLTYLAVSLTPMLGSGETLVDFWLKVENNKITKIYGQTTVLYDGTTEVSRDDADIMTFTTVELSIENIDNTSIPNAKAYDAPQNADKLTAALTYMSSIKNYTFDALDVQTSAPATDGSDYEYQSVSNSTVKALRSKRALSLKNYTSSSGKVGTYGMITEKAVLYETTTKFEATMDGKDYQIQYSGLYQNDDNTYDTFGFNKDYTAFEGKQKFNGSMFNALPSFDFSANVFEFVKEEPSKNTTLYTFRLREEMITRDIAMSVSAYQYAIDAERDNRYRTTITVDSEGHVVKTVYPYNLVDYTYAGYITTEYSNFETTNFDEGDYKGCFDNYIPRKIRTNWSEFDVMYYHPTFTTQVTEQATADKVFKVYLGDDYKNLPSPKLFFEIFGDSVSGPFFDYDNKGSDDNPDYIQWLGITVKTDKCDENYQVSEDTFNEIKKELDTKLGALGYKLNTNNTDLSGGATGRSDYYLCYTNGNIQIVINTNHTRYFWIDFYKLGDWSLKK